MVKRLKGLFGNCGSKVELDFERAAEQIELNDSGIKYVSGLLKLLAVSLYVSLLAYYILLSSNS